MALESHGKSLAMIFGLEELARNFHTAVKWNGLSLNFQPWHSDMAIICFKLIIKGCNNAN